MLSVGLIGFGSISRDLVRILGARSGTKIDVTGIFVRQPNAAATATGFRVHERIDGLLADRPDVVTECAGQKAVHAYGEAVLASGCDLVIASVGALADAELRRRLEAAAGRASARIHVPAGAVGGLDALGALRLAGLTSVRYRAHKPPGAWKGSPADAVCDLDHLQEPAIVFRGNAREAGLKFPRNSNVAATVALAGAGFEDTEVELVADPDCSENIHELEVEGTAGSFRIVLTGNPSPENPRTSMLTSHSIARMLLDMAGTHVISM